MSQKHYNTGPLWQWLIFLIILLLGIILSTLVYSVFKADIVAYENKATYSKEYLEEYTKRRMLQRKVDKTDNWDLVENGIHVRTGLKSDKNIDIIIASCTSCHSAKLITQNRATRNGWQSMIKWMQATQGLQDLGEREPIILDYLAKYYAPQEVGRRENLDMASIEWYMLELGE